MCGRYTLYETKSIKKTFNIGDAQLELKDNYNVAPGQYMPVVVRATSSDTNEIQTMRWGFIPSWAKDIKIGYKLINAKSETLFEKPMWKNAALHKRCLVPAHGFYEWQLQPDGKTKIPYFIHTKNTKLFAFAGVYSSWKDVEGREIPSYTIITTEPNAEMSSIHNRMPVIFTKEEAAEWLDERRSTQEQLELLLHPYQNNGLEIYKVSPDVNSARNNFRELIYKMS